MLAVTLRRGDALAALLHERLVVSSVRQLRGATARLMDAPEAVSEAPPASTDDYVARVAARIGVDPDALEDMRADTDLPANWKRPIR